MRHHLQQLLTETRHAGIYHVPHNDARALEQAARALGFGWLHADLGGLHEHAPVLEKLGKDLALPEWYGANFDALADCLSDLSWQEAPGYVVLIGGADELHAHAPDIFETLNQVFNDVIAGWRQDGKPFWVFYDLRANGQAPLPTLAIG